MTKNRPFTFFLAFFSMHAGIWLIYAYLLGSVSCFLLPKRSSLSLSKPFYLPLSTRQYFPYSHILFSSSFDYEYIPHRGRYEDSNDNNDDNHSWSIHSSPLPSRFPPAVPASLRGEAVRSALRSSRCLVFSFPPTSPLSLGLVRLDGPGCVTFLQNKFTQNIINNNNNMTTMSPTDQFYSTLWLNAKGRVVDRLGVALTSDRETAFLVSSLGHDSRDFFRSLDAFVFPRFDHIRLQNCCGGPNYFSFTVASTQHESVQTLWTRQILPLLREHSWLDSSPAEILLPTTTEFKLISKTSNTVTEHLLIVPTQHLPPHAAIEYTFFFLESSVGHIIWKELIDEANQQGPIEIGELEFETLRIETGQPAFGKEMTGSVTTITKTSSTNKNAEKKTTPASPLELLMDEFIDVNKGCFLGQEGVASILKNPRGPPRMLYHVVFDDDNNMYDNQSKQSSSSNNDHDNLTRTPRVGDVLYVLGSNEEIMVGTLTSIAEPGGTGEPSTIALALLRRPDSILKQMKTRDLHIPSPHFMLTDNLDGLEVIVGGTFTVGMIKVLPSFLQRFDGVANNFPNASVQQDRNDDSNVNDDNSNNDYTFGNNDIILNPVIDIPHTLETTDDDKAPWEFPEFEQTDDNDTSNIISDDVDRMLAEAEQAQIEANAVAVEAKRKADKLAFLKQQAEAALARRNAKKNSNND